MSGGKVAKPSKFKAALSNTGVDTAYGDYEKTEDSSAMIVAYTTVDTLCKALVGEKAMNNFKLDLAINLLASIKGYDEEKLAEWVRESRETPEETLHSWTIEKLYGDDEE